MNSQDLPEGPLKGTKRSKKKGISVTQRLDRLCTVAAEVSAASRKRGKYNVKRKVLVPKDLMMEVITKADRQLYPSIYSTLQTRRRLDAKCLNEQPLDPDKYFYNCGSCGVKGPHVCPFVRVDLEEVTRLFHNRRISQLYKFLSPHGVEPLQELNAEKRKPNRKNNKKSKSPRFQNPKKGKKKPNNPDKVGPMSEEEVVKFTQSCDDNYARTLLEVISSSDEDESSSDDSSADPLKEEVDLVEQNSSFFADFPSTLQKIRETITVEAPELSRMGKYADLVENVCILAFQIYKSRSFEEIVVAVIVYIKTCTKKPITESCCKFLESIFAEVEEDSQEKQELNGELSFSTKWELFTKHRMYDKVIYLIGVAIGMTSCEQNEIEWKWGNIQLIKIPVINTVQGAFNILDAVIKVAIWMFQTGAACLEEGSFTPILYSDQMTQKMNDEFNKCVEYESTMVTGKIHYGTALLRISDTIKMYKEYKAKLGDKITSTLADKRLERLDALRVAIEMRLHGSGLKTRAMGVCFQGPSGIGKSFFQAMVIRPFFASIGVKYEPWMKAVLNPGMEHDNTVFNEKRYAELDDFANAKAEFYKDVLTDYILRVLNSTPHVANKADLESKGKTYYNFDLLCLTCNPKNLNADKFTDHYEAVLNRILYVEVQVKPEFRQEGNLSLAQHDPNVIDVNFWEQDFWEFSIKRCVVAQDEAGKRIGVVDRVVRLPNGEKLLCSKLSIKQFRRAYSCLCKQHAYGQGRSLQRAKEIDDEPLCFACANIKRECMCMLYSNEHKHDRELSHFYDSSVAEIAYPDLKKAPAPKKEVSSESWNKLAQLFRNTEKQLDQETNGIKEVIVDSAKTAVWDYLSQPFSSVFWWNTVLGYSPVKHLTTRRIAGEMKDYLTNISTPWFISCLPADFVRSNTYRWFVGRMASGTAWVDTKRLMRSFMVLQSVCIGTLCYQYPRNRKTIASTLGLGCLAYNTVVAQVMHHSRAKALQDSWTQRSDALTEGNRELRNSSWKGIATVAIPITIIALKALAVWNEKQHVNSAADSASVRQSLTRRILQMQRPKEEDDDDDDDEADSDSDSDSDKDDDDCDVPPLVDDEEDEDEEAEDEDDDEMRKVVELASWLINKARGKPPPDMKIVEDNPKIDQNISDSWMSGIEGKADGIDCNSATRTTTHSQMISSIKKSCMGRITVWRDDNNSMSCNMFVVETGIAIVPRHLFYGDKWGAFFQSKVFGARSRTSKYWVKETFRVDYQIREQSLTDYLRIGSTAIPIPNQDLMLITLPMGTAKSRRAWLPDTTPKGTYPADYVTINKENRSPWTGSVSVTCEEIRDHPDLLAYAGGKYVSDLSYGQCMSPIIPRKKKPFILGLHISSSPKDKSGRCAILTKGQYDEAVKQLAVRNSSYLPQMNSDQVPNSIMNKPVIVGPVHPKAHIPNEKVIPLGSTKVRRSQVSRVRKTVAHDAATSVFGHGAYKAPELKPNWKHFNTGLDQISEPMTCPDIATLNWAVEDYTSSLRDIIRKHELRARPLTELETFCGNPHVKYIDAMNHSTSGGFNSNGRKDKHYKVEYTDGVASAITLDDTLRAEMDRVEGEIKKGKRPWFVYSSCLKDEVVDETKESVRVFQMMSLAGSAYVRKYFLPIVSFLQHHPLESEIAVGLDASSPNWEKLMNYVKSFGSDRLMGFDYSKYDKKIVLQLMRAACRILIDLAIELGYDKEHIEYMLVIQAELCKPVVDWNGTLFEFLNSNPSGNNLTVILNSIINALLVRCFFAEIWQLEKHGVPPAFRDWVHATFYGDDALLTVRAGLEGFHNIGYWLWLAGKGMKITPPQKDQEFTKFLAKDDADYLKRKSHYQEDIKCFVGALDVASIKKPLYYRLDSDATDEEHTFSVMASLMTESFLHGRAFFEEMHAKCLEIEEVLGWNIPALRISYDQRVERWKKRFRVEH